jgi:hypothetical protein
VQGDGVLQDACVNQTTHPQMKTQITAGNETFTFKSFKTVKWMSEETLCFTATLCLNGKAIGTAENDGHGGCTFIRFNSPELREKYEEQFKALGKPLDEIADELADLEMEAKHYANHIKRIRKDCSLGIAFLAKDEVLTNGYRTCKGDRVKVEGLMLAKYGSITVLNDLSDEQIIALSK